MSVEAVVEQPIDDTRRQGVQRIDTDSHNTVFEQDLKPYMSSRWSDYLDLIGLRNTANAGLTVGAHPMACRTDSWGPEGQPPGTDPERYCHQLLDLNDIDIAILNSTLAQNQAMMGPGSPAELMVEFTRAGNEWEADVWLDADQRLRGAMCLPFEHPAASVAEIERCGQDRRFVQIVLPFRTLEPLGHERYWPMFEAAEAADLPIALHPASQHVMSGSGWQSFYYEHHTALPTVLLEQMASLIFAGVFDRFPKLQILFQEGGWSWAPPFMRRLDRSWGQLRDEVPDLARKPSEYAQEHFWFTTQPIEEPDKPAQFLALWKQFEDAGMGKQLMFSSDYPHWDFDAPDVAIPKSLPEDVRTALFLDNPLACYGRMRSE